MQVEFLAVSQRAARSMMEAPRLSLPLAPLHAPATVARTVRTAHPRLLEPYRPCASILSSSKQVVAVTSLASSCDVHTIMCTLHHHVHTNHTIACRWVPSAEAGGVPNEDLLSTGSQGNGDFQGARGLVEQVRATAQESIADFVLQGI